MRTLRALGAAALIAPGAVWAQQARGAPAPATYTVKVGDTLWELAATYLKDPHLWTEIFKLNKEKIADPHWIFPGEILVMPGVNATVEVAVTPPVPVAVTPPPTPPAAEPQRPVQPVPVNPRMPTMFAPRVPRGADSGARPATEVVPPTVRPDEYLTAPYVVRPLVPLVTGRIVKAADLTGTVRSNVAPIFKAFDNVFIEPPPGEAVAVGQRYAVVRMGPLLDGVGQVIIPTGIVEVKRAPRGEEATVAEVTRLFDEVKPNQLLVALDTMGSRSTARPRAIADGRWATIKWVASEPVLPTVQAYVVLDVGANDGVKPGDEFQVFEPRSTSRSGPDLPEIPVGRAQAVRVTAYGTTAIITSQEQPAIHVGSLVRTSAKMP